MQIEIYFIFVYYGVFVCGTRAFFIIFFLSFCFRTVSISQLNLTVHFTKNIQLSFTFPNLWLNIIQTFTLKLPTQTKRIKKLICGKFSFRPTNQPNKEKKMKRERIALREKKGTHRTPHQPNSTQFLKHF